MLTKEENELLTRVGPGTAGGVWTVRRYWHPVAATAQLNANQFGERWGRLQRLLAVI